MIATSRLTTHQYARFNISFLAAASISHTRTDIVLSPSQKKRFFLLKHHVLKMNNTSNDPQENDTSTATGSSQANNEWKYKEEYRPPWLPALVLFPPLAPCFWKYHVRVSDKILSLGYSHFFCQDIERATMKKADPIEYINGFTQFGGWGYRKSVDLQWITRYIAKNGPGIRLAYKEKEKDKTIVFNCDDAERVCRILNTPVVNAVVH